MTELRRSNAGLLQKRPIRATGFTKAKRTRFLDVLAATCNIETAARMAGISAAMARTLRRRDGHFARLWAEAVDQGQERLKEEVIARALGQVIDEDTPDIERAPVPDAPFDVDLALRILQIQARSGPTGQRRSVDRAVPTREAVFAALAKRLDEMDTSIARRAPAIQPSAPSRPSPPTTPTTPIAGKR